LALHPQQQHHPPLCPRADGVGTALVVDGLGDPHSEAMMTVVLQMVEVVVVVVVVAHRGVSVDGLSRAAANAVDISSCS